MNASEALALAIIGLVRWQDDLTHDANKFHENESLHDIAYQAQVQHAQLSQAIATLQTLQQVISGDE